MKMCMSAGISNVKLGHILVLGCLGVLLTCLTKVPGEVLTGGPGEALQLDDVRLSNIFPVLHKLYDKHPFGTAVFSNPSGYSATNISLSIEIKPFTTAPKQCPIQTRLEPGASLTVDLYALFSERQILAVTEDTNASVGIKWKYVVNGQQKSGKNVATVQILSRNAVTWDDFRKLAAFVTPRDPAVMTFSKNVLNVVRSAGNDAVDPHVLTAIAFYEALCQYGMNYLDPGYGRSALIPGGATDHVQFPQQTLAYKGGKGSDLSILFCALLESVGIPTAFIIVPDQVFMAFSLSIRPDEARRTFQRPDDLIFLRDTAWLPVEVTSLDGKFLEAWHKGAKEWREGFVKGKASFYTLKNAWETYGPAGLIGDTFEVSVPRVDIVAEACKREVQLYHLNATLKRKQQP